MIKHWILGALNKLGYHLVRIEPACGTGHFEDIPDAQCYQPFFSPWLCDGEFNAVFSRVAPTTVVSIDRCHALWTLAAQASRLDGDFVECGVYQGGTARLLAEAIRRGSSGQRLHLFDTFSGMPETGTHDLHSEGDFADTSLAGVKKFVGHPDIAVFHPGYIPDTFQAVGNLSIAFAHIDVDIHASVLACCEFVYPRLSPGGFMVFDDYGCRSCPGARKAVDEFFADKPEHPLVLPNGQAVVTRIMPRAGTPAMPAR